MPAASPSERFALFDTMRFIAIVGIVWMHAVESPLGVRFHDIGRFGVPFFVMGSMLFMAQGLQRRPELRWGMYLRSRILRLYVPFLIWTAIYYAARQVKHAFFPSESELALKWQSLYIGQAAHTWFLPFLLIINLVGFWIVRFVQSYQRYAVPAAIALLLTTIGLFALPLPPSVGDAPANHFIYCAWFALPSATLGLSVALAWPNVRAMLQNPAALGLGAIISVAALVLVVRSGRSVPLETLAGLGVFVVSLQPMQGLHRFGESIGRHSFDIYLNHVLFIEAMQAILKRAGFRPSLTSDALLVVVAVVLGLLLSVATERAWRRVRKG